jgi:hypothetical protein
MDGAMGPHTLQYRSVTYTLVLRSVKLVIVATGFGVFLKSEHDLGPRAKQMRMVDQRD